MTPAAATTTTEGATTTTTNATEGASTSATNVGDVPQKFVKYGRAIHFIGDIKPELRHRTVFTAHIDATGKISISLQNNVKTSIINQRLLIRAPRGFNSTCSWNWAEQNCLLISTRLLGNRGSITVELE